ncbi:MAG: glycosyl hydrolase [Eubacteriales bacterium]|nr:glycosyl hydrolase [Eubacteriales bacterium]
MDWKERLSGDLTEYQSIPFWSWNDRLEPEELRRQIRAMKRAGIGGFFMHARGGLLTEYLGEEWFEAAAACIDEAGRQGMHAWCYDENGWPSGFAGMKLLRDPENWAHYLTSDRTRAFDPAALAVYRLSDGVLRRVREDEGDADYLCLYDRTNSSVVDILNPRIVRDFIAETHERYYARFPESFGGVMQGFFTDEPQYFRWDTAYSPVLRDAYRARWGEELLDSLGALFVDCEGAKKLRWRYWKLANELYAQSFARQIYEWCEAHHSQLTGHSIEERNLFWQMCCCAGVMPFYEYEHIPGMDWLGRDIADERAPRQVSSAAQQLGKRHVLTETFACAGWDVTPRELKRIAEWQYVNGVNLMCQHLYPYSIRGQRKRDYPAFYSEHNPWVRAEFRPFNDYFTALGTMLADSREEADTVVLHPMHAAYLVYDRHDEHTLDALDASFSRLCERLGSAGVGHHYADESILAAHGSVEGARLRIGRCIYSCVVIPEMETIDAPTAALLREYLAEGGRLYLDGAAPTLCEGEPADLSFLRANTTFAELPRGRARISREDTAIRYTTRASEAGDFVFAVNLSERESYDVTFRIRADGVRRFDAMRRESAPEVFTRSGEDVLIRRSFAPGESVIWLMSGGEPATMPAHLPEPRKIALDAAVAAYGENALTIDTVRLSYDGVQYTEPLPVMAASDRLLRERKNRKVYLKYTFSVSKVPEKIRLEREKMGARQAWFNGAPLTFDGNGTLDRAFVSADLSGRVREGENELVLEIEYFQPDAVYDVFNGVYYEHSDGTESLINCLSYVTDIEAVYLFGDFGVYARALSRGEKGTWIAEGGFTVGARREQVDADALARCGYPFFEGELTMEFPFTARGDERRLRLAGRYAAARVSVNGGGEQTLLFEDAADVAGQLRAGENTLRVTLLSGGRNLFGPFHYAPDPEPYGVSPDLFSGYGRWEDGKNPDYRASYAFAHFGLDEITLQ